MDRLKFIEMDGYHIRLLEYQLSLANQQKIKRSLVSEADHRFMVERACKKPDNSEEKCNLVVKNLPLHISELELECYFSENYGPVQSCKIAKQPNGRPKPYGFVWFKEGRDANKAILESKSGKCPFKLEWYQILSQRLTDQKQKTSGEFNQIFVSWFKKDLNSGDSLTKDDILKVYLKYGTIVDLDFQSEKNRALIVYDSNVDAECAVVFPSLTLKGY